MSRDRMSTTGTEKHCRLCLMLNKGGTKACHSLFMKRVEELTPSDHQPYPWTVHEFLQSKKDMLKSNISKEKMQVLFPRVGVTDLAKWDLSLFCTILTTYCGLKHLKRLDVERLRTLRNELCHMNEPHIDDVKYKDYFETIQVIVTRILENNNDNETKKSIEKLLNDIHEGPLSLVETLKEMHTFYSMEMDIREKLEYVKDVNERVLQKVEKFDELFERFDSMLEQFDNKLDHETSSRLHSARNNFLLPGVEIFLDLQNLSQDEEQRMSTVLEQLFQEVINEEEDFISSIPADSYNKLREAVRKTFKLFLMKGWRITSARHECVQLHIRCLTFKSLAALFREHVQGHINEELRDLNFAISEIICRKDAQLETEIYKDEFWGVMDRTMSAVEEFLTDQGRDTNPMLKEKLQPYDGEKKHALALTARNVTHERRHTFVKECKNELDTCLGLLKTELGTEFNAPQVSVQASCKSKNTEAVTNQESSTDENTTTPEEIEIEKNVPVEKNCEKEQDSCLGPLETESETECDTPDLPVQASYTAKSYLPSASTSMSPGVELSSYETPSKAQVDSDNRDTLQTIALLEIYKSQRAIAHYLELAYLSFYDYPDIKNEVFAASQSAMEIHRETADRNWYHLVDELCWELDDLNIDDIFGIDMAIEFACRLKTLTEELQKSYIELQSIIRKSFYFERRRRLEKEIMYYDSLPDIRRVIIDKDESRLENETQLTMLRPGAALTGGISPSRSVHSFQIFESICLGKELDLLAMVYHKHQEDGGTDSDREIFVQRMLVQRTEAFKRLETIKKCDYDDCGIVCLREVDKHLKYIDIQFERINDCWSEVIFALRLLRTKKDIQTFYMLDKWKRTSVQKEWEFVHGLFWDYSFKSERDTHNLYRFLSEFRKADPVKRRRILFLVIEKEISGTYLSPDSGKSSDQRRDTDVESKEKLLSGKGKT